MELREFAERILFGASIEDKLVAPDSITDERPGPAISSPEAPGRPPELEFKKESQRNSDFPGLQRLESEQERGRLLHFFANHELLATELMALVLLRFPDAPKAFRRGVLQTLRDEQEHTRLYLERMRDCGIQFGELPVSGYFWRAVSTMESPMDYVAGLSLTFEQANLDFARHFSQSFAQVGDEETAKLLDRIHRDEIGHVAYGLKWFRRWKNPEETDWQAFKRQLKFPLSPQRAKGTTLNVEARQAAGLDATFIAELNVYSQSKGRTPSVFVFNPFAEGYIAQGASFTPVKHQAQLARDLATLPQFLCRQDDVVLVPQRPSTEFLSELKENGFPLPEFVEMKGRNLENHPLVGRKLADLRPWAWGPDSVELLQPLFPHVTAGRHDSHACFNSGIAQFYSKAWSTQLLREFLQETHPKGKDADCVCPNEIIGVLAKSTDTVLNEVKAIRQRGHHRVVLKKPFGLAGQNALRLWEPNISDAQKRWIESAITAGQGVVVEPWLERLVDFSVQLEMTARGLLLRGFTGLLNDHRGQFEANWAEPNFERHLPTGVTRFLPDAKSAFQVERMYQRLFELLESRLKAAGFLGPLGIDALIYRDAEEKPRVKPVVEINPRYTMGRLTLELMRHTRPGAYGKFSLIGAPAVRAQGFEDLLSYATALRKQFPIRMEGEPVRRIREGAVCLNDPGAARAVLAVFQVNGEKLKPEAHGSN